MPGAGVCANVQLEARDSTMRALAPGATTEAGVNDGFLNAFSNDVASSVVGVGGAEASDGDGLGKCVLRAPLVTDERLETSGVDEFTPVLSSLEVVAPSFFSAALMFNQAAVVLITRICNCSNTPMRCLPSGTSSM